MPATNEPSPAPARKERKPVDLPGLWKQLTASTDASRMSKVKSMLRADRFQLFSEVTGEKVLGIVKSQTDHELFYSCKLDHEGNYTCCTQNLNRCGGLNRGGLCKHLLVLVIGLAQAGELEADTVSQWAKATKKKAPAIDKDEMSAAFLKYKGAQSGEVDWRPTETIPEDYSAI